MDSSFVLSPVENLLVFFVQILIVKLIGKHLLIFYYQPGTHVMFLRLSVCSSANITCAKLRHSVTMPL